ALAALIPRFENHAAEALARLHDLEHHLVLRQLAAQREYLLRITEHLLRGRVGSAVQLIEHEALVFLGREFGLRGHAEQEGRTGQEDAHYHDDFPRHQPAAQAALVGVVHALELTIDELHEAPALLLALEEARAQHRRQRQRDDRRNRHRARKRESELGEQRAGQTFLEADR